MDNKFTATYNKTKKITIITLLYLALTLYLRHTCISMLAEAKVEPTIIKTIAGHSGTMSLTESVYTHLDIQTLIDAVNLI